MALNFFEEGGLLNFYKAGGSVGANYASIRSAIKKAVDGKYDRTTVESGNIKVDMVNNPYDLELSFYIGERHYANFHSKLSYTPHGKFTSFNSDNAECKDAIEKTKKALEELGYTITNVVEGDWDIVDKFSGGGEIKIRKTNFHSHKNHNPDCDILEGYIDDDSFITYGVYVKDAMHGSKKGDEFMEYYSGENYVPGSKKRSNSKHFTVSEIPAKYLAAWNKLKEDYKANYAEIVVTPVDDFAGGGSVAKETEYVGWIHFASKATAPVKGASGKVEDVPVYGGNLLYSVTAKDKKDAEKKVMERFKKEEQLVSNEKEYVITLKGIETDKDYRAGIWKKEAGGNVNTILDYYNLSKYDKATVRSIVNINNSLLNLEGLQVKLRALDKNGNLSKEDYYTLKELIETLGGKMPEGIIVSSKLEEGGNVSYEDGGYPNLVRMHQAENMVSMHQAAMMKPEEEVAEAKELAILDAWGKYAASHDKDEDDIDDFNAYLNKVHSKLSFKEKQKAIREFQVTHPEPDFAGGGAVEPDTLVEVIDVINAWEKYAKRHDKDVDDINDFNAYLNKEQTSLGAKKKQAAIKEFAQIHKEDDEFAEGGEVKPISPTEHYRYLEITKYPNGLELAINDEGREEVKEWQEDEKGDYEIMGELFDTVQGNSEYMWHENLGDKGFGLTSAPGITDGYYYDDDNGELTDKGQEDSAELYSFMAYELHSPLELLLRDGKVFFARVPKEGDESTLAILNEQHKDSYSLIETDDRQ